MNILPKNPYLAKRGFLENLIFLKSKKDDFQENLPNCQKEVSNVKINEGKGSIIRKMPNFSWICPKFMGAFGKIFIHVKNWFAG